MFMMIQHNYSFSGCRPFMFANPLMMGRFSPFMSNPFMMGCFNPRMNFMFGMAAATAAMQTSYQPQISMNPCSVFNPSMPINYLAPYTMNGLGSINYQPLLNQGFTTPMMPNFYYPNITALPTPSFSSLNSLSDTQKTEDKTKQQSLKYNKNSLSEFKNSGIMRNVPESRKNQILSAVDEACKKYDMDPKLVLSMMYNESSFDPNATSSCGAAGLMQLMPATAKAYGANNVYDIRENIFAGVKYLNYLRQKYNGNRDLMVAAYNAGPGRVHNTIPNIKETKNYVAKVNNTYSSLA